ncbi:MAG: diphosphate--fructose-6-phosphate 1-phosphotransferase [Candidatus Sumerlaeia bacterium]|nr:diphosphate--fructose-6-phosphate 1-phosphotransferase [Candidatus Sumerlaeia bacterium]
MNKKAERNLLIAQSGGPTMVINQSLVGIVEAAKKHREVNKILGALYGFEGILKKRFVDLKTESKKVLEQVAKTPGSALYSCRFEPKEEDCRAALEIMKQFQVHYFFYIGGNDSAVAASKLNEIARQQSYELRVFHVPKTVDNDLLLTHHCPGYGSAARYVALAFMGDDLDNRSLPGVKINVCMGRNAGWLTGASALARQGENCGPHLIYLPERKLTIKKFVEDVLEVNGRFKRVQVAVSEGVVGNDGLILIQSKDIRDELKQLQMGELVDWLDMLAKVEEASGDPKRDAFNNIQLSGSGVLGDFLSAVVKMYAFKHKGIKKLRVRADTLGYPQRSFMEVASTVDMQEARLVGEKAVEYCMRGDIDGSVIIKRLGTEDDEYAIEIQYIELRKIADPNRPSHEQIKRVPDNFINAAGNDVTPEFIKYARPLVGKLPKKGFLSYKMVE